MMMIYAYTKIYVSFFSAYETLADESRRREYDQFSGASYFTEENQRTRRQSDHQSFYDLNDIFKDFGIFSQNRHARQHRAFHEHSRSNSRLKRPSEAGFEPDIFDDSEDFERIFTFDDHTKKTQNRFHGPSKQQCRTVMQRRGNIVTTYTDCTVS